METFNERISLLKHTLVHIPDSNFCRLCHQAADALVHYTEGENADLNTEVKVDGQTLKTGEKKDEGKPRWELFPYDAAEGAVVILTSGAIKYAARNWEKGIAYGRVFGALMRHLWKWWMAKVLGESGLDAESGKSHLDHALCELLFLCAYEKRGMTELDDRPVK